MRLVSTAITKPGQLVAKPIYDASVRQIFSKDHELTEKDILWLKNNDIPNLYIHDSLSQNIELQTLVDDELKAQMVLSMIAISEQILARQIERVNYFYIIEQIIQQLYDCVVSKANLNYFATDLVGKDIYHYDHAIETALLSMMVGKRLNYTQEQLMHLGVGALMCDIGKIKIPIELLNKKGQLTQEDILLFRQHVGFSIAMVKAYFFIPDESFEIVKYHHEKLNGKGYPFGLKDTDLSLNVRIVTICDMFTAMVTDRGYNERTSICKALDTLRQMAPFEIDIDILQILNQVVDKYPVGTIVELSNGAIGIVKKNNEHAPSRPVIDIIENDFPIREMDLMSDLTVFIKET